MTETNETRSPFEELVNEELAKARRNYADMPTIQHAYAVLLEEVEEFRDEVRIKDALRCEDRLLRECVQIAAMARRTAEDLGWVDKD